MSYQYYLNMQDNFLAPPTAFYTMQSGIQGPRLYATYLTSHFDCEKQQHDIEYSKTNTYSNTNEIRLINETATIIIIIWNLFC